MIGLLKGILREVEPPTLLIDVNGVGYECTAPLSTCCQFTEMNVNVTLHIHSSTREDGTFLYAFLDKAERDFFRRLIKINGIGPKAALAILSNISPEQCLASLNQNDLTIFKRIPGIGPKMAQRLLLELAGSASTVTTGPKAEATMALTSLGYKPAEIQKALAKATGNDPQDLIKQALAKLAIA